MKRLIVVLLAGIMVFGLAGCGASGSVDADPAEEKSLECDYVDVLVEQGYSEDEAQSIGDVLVSVGIDDLSIVYAEAEQEDGSRMVVCLPNNATNDRCRAYFLTENGVCVFAAVNNIGGNGDIYTSDRYTLYDTEAGGFVREYEDVISEIEVNSTEEASLMEMTEQMAKQIAKNPSTVDFQLFAWAFEQYFEGNENVFWVQGVFSCSNLLGVSEERTITMKYVTYSSGSAIKGVKVWLDGALVADEE